MKAYLLFLGAFTISCLQLLGQGSVLLDNSIVTNRVSIDVAENPYSGIYGLEVWQSGNTNASLSGALDVAASANSQAAYEMLISSGFRLEYTYVAETMVQGVFQLSGVKMPGVRPPGSTVTLALVAWNSGAASWDAAVASGAKGGLIAFVQPTANYAMPTPPGAPDLNWTIPQDLVMMSTVPEPSGSVLVVFGGAVFLLFRYWKINRG